MQLQAFLTVYRRPSCLPSPAKRHQIGPVLPHGTPRSQHTGVFQPLLSIPCSRQLLQCCAHPGLSAQIVAKYGINCRVHKALGPKPLSNSLLSAHLFPDALQNYMSSVHSRTLSEVYSVKRRGSVKQLQIAACFMRLLSSHCLTSI
jgi:hypothetical protein